MRLTRILTALAAALLAAFCLPAAGVAQASAESPCDAVVSPADGGETAPLFARAGDSESLMDYYRGARLTAVRPAGGGFWRVQIGRRGAALVGYMRADDLRFDAPQAQREVQPAYMRLKFNEEAAVYGWPDEGAPRLGACVPDHTYYAVSRSDGGWVQLFLPPAFHAALEPGERAAAGFVHLAPGTAIGYFEDGMDFWTVDPLPGDMTREDALQAAAQAARTWYAQDQDEDSIKALAVYGWDEAAFAQEALLATVSAAFLAASPEGQWNVFFCKDISDGVIWVRIGGQRNGRETGPLVYFVSSDDYEREYSFPFQL